MATHSKELESPLVSIIIPVFNAERFLEATIQSALNQTWENIEVIIIDDGSKDNSLKIAEKFRSEQVRVFNQENSGASAARNKGLQEAQGSYIQFLDADDLISPEKIEKQIQLISDNPDKIAIAATIYFYEDSNPLLSSPPVRDAAFYESATNPQEFLINLYGKKGNGGIITTHSWLTPKNIIDKAGPWDETLTVDDDGEFFCRVVLNSKEIVLAEGVFNYYRKYRKRISLSSQNSYSAKRSAFHSMCLKEKHISIKMPKEAYAKTFATSYYQLAVTSYPQHKSLSKEGIAKANELNKAYRKYALSIGGVLSNFMANQISWKLARYIQYYIQKLRF